MINGAEQLKNLAACVNEIRNEDGTVVKEYILNDPKIIENIRNQMRSSSQSSILENSGAMSKQNSTYNNNNLSNQNASSISSMSNSTVKFNTNKNEGFKKVETSSNKNNNNNNGFLPTTVTQNNFASSSMIHFQDMTDFKNKTIRACRVNESSNQTTLYSNNSMNSNCSNYNNRDQQMSPLPSLASSTMTSTMSNAYQKTFQKYQNLSQAPNTAAPPAMPPPPPPPPQPPSAPTTSTLSPNLLLSSADIFKQTRPNCFEFKTKKGKILQLALMNHDLAGEDVQELFSVFVKYAEFLEQEKNVQQVVKTNSNTSFTPHKQLSLNSNNKNVLKSGSLGNLCDEKSTASSFSSDDSNRIKSNQPQNKPLPQNMMMKQQVPNKPVYYSFLAANNSHRQFDSKLKNSYKAKSNEDLLDLNGSGDRSSKANSISSNNNINVNNNNGNALKPVNTCTYTKSMLNNNNENKAAEQESNSDRNSPPPSLRKSSMHKSMDNLISDRNPSESVNNSYNNSYNSSNTENQGTNRKLDITPEMTEHLLLKLLLQQITNEKLQKQRFKEQQKQQQQQQQQNDSNSLNAVEMSSSSRTSISQPKLIQNNNNNRASSNLASNKLSQKSMSNILIDEKEQQQQQNRHIESNDRNSVQRDNFKSNLKNYVNQSNHAKYMKRYS
jgi:hypothetical protein